MESVGELPADALPAGWSSGGAGARDPEAAQRQAQQVRALFMSVACVQWFCGFEVEKTCRAESNVALTRTSRSISKLVAQQLSAAELWMISNVAVAVKHAFVVRF